MNRFEKTIAQKKMQKDAENNYTKKEVSKSRKIIVSVTLPKETLQKLDNACLKIDRQRPYIIEKLIEQFIDEIK